MTAATLHKAVDQLIEKTNKDLGGKGRILRADEYILPHLLRRVPSGFPSLDIATAGGLPAGAFIELVGPPSTGKSELAVLYMAMQQVIWGPLCALGAAQTEFHFDKLYAKRRGLRVPLHDKEIAAMERAEGEPFDAFELEYFKDTVGEFLEAFSPTAEVVWEMVIRMIKARYFKIVLIDSLGALMPKAEHDDSMDDKHYSGSAAVNTQAFHKFHGAMGLEEEGLSNDTLVLGINQVRDKIGAASWDTDPKIGGGNAKDHGKSCCILLEQAARIFSKKDGETHIQLGKMVRWKIVKGKHGFHEGARGELRYLWKYGFDRAFDILNEAMMCGFITKAGSWYSIGDKDIVDDKGAVLVEAGKKLGQGEEKVCTFMRTNDGVMDVLYDMIMRDAGIHVNFT